MDGFAATLKNVSLKLAGVPLTDTGRGSPLDLVEGQVWKEILLKFLGFRKYRLKMKVVHVGKRILKMLFKTERLPWLGGLVGWSSVPYTKMLWVRLSGRGTYLVPWWVRSLVGVPWGGN